MVVLGPPLVERARIPGLIGLLLGGFLIGPHGFGLLDAGSTTIPDLGQLGLLYLMFVAGVELDLALLREHRRTAVMFGVMTFAFPMVFGTVAGALLGWELAAALLLGSLLASHTLVLYPAIRQAGLANDPIVASAVGATVLTDTLALIILAVIAGTESGTGSSAEIALQLVLGMTTLGVFCFVVLPWLIGHAFQLLGGDRAVRYVIAVAAFLAAAVVAETFGIEGIVGAFFAGLALNRLVPSHGPLMNRIDFFGVAVFVPVFLVSVGLLLDPKVMVQVETLGLAAAFIAACLGGKLVAAQLTRPLMGATSAQAGVVFGLTVPQAAATLAATTVGFQIGLFSESVVNAVLVLILVSVVVATLVVEREKVRVEIPPPAGKSLGEHVLVAVADLDAAPLGAPARAGHRGSRGGRGRRRPSGAGRRDGRRAPGRHRPPARPLPPARDRRRSGACASPITARARRSSRRTTSRRRCCSSPATAMSPGPTSLARRGPGGGRARRAGPPAADRAGRRARGRGRRRRAHRRHAAGPGRAREPRRPAGRAGGARRRDRRRRRLGRAGRPRAAGRRGARARNRRPAVTTGDYGSRPRQRSPVPSPPSSRSSPPPAKLDVTSRLTRLVPTLEPSCL